MSENFLFNGPHEYNHRELTELAEFLTKNGYSKKKRGTENILKIYKSSLENIKGKDQSLKNIFSEYSNYYEEVYNETTCQKINLFFKSINSNFSWEKFHSLFKNIPLILVTNSLISAILIGWYITILSGEKLTFSALIYKSILDQILFGITINNLGLLLFPYSSSLGF